MCEYCYPKELARANVKFGSPAIEALVMEKFGLKKPEDILFIDFKEPPRVSEERAERNKKKQKFLRT